MKSWQEVKAEVRSLIGAGVQDLAARFELTVLEANTIFLNETRSAVFSMMQERALEDDDYKDRIRRAYEWAEENLEKHRRAERRLILASQWSEDSGIWTNNIGKAASELGVECSSFF
jgi:hypothetical protein